MCEGKETELTSLEGLLKTKLGTSLLKSFVNFIFCSMSIVGSAVLELLSFVESRAK